MLGRQFTTLGKDLARLQVRSVSSKYPRPTPRPYRRRLFEAALQPILPKEVKTCIPPESIHANNKREAAQYSDVELALVRLVRQWVEQEGMRVMAVCQFLPVQGRQLWFAKNQLRGKGVEFRNYGNRIMRGVFDKTPLQSIDHVFVGSNACLFGRDMDALRTIIKETDRFNWIVPMVLVVDSRIVSIGEARALADLPALDDVRAHTVQLLEQQLSHLPATLDQAVRGLAHSLDNHLAAHKTEGDSQ